MPLIFIVKIDGGLGRVLSSVDFAVPNGNATIIHSTTTLPWRKSLCLILYHTGVFNLPPRGP